MSSEENPPPAGIDTNVLIYAYRTDFSVYTDAAERSKQKRLSAYSVRLIDRLRKEKRQILLSTVSVGEFLAKEPVHAHKDLIRQLEAMFTIVSYNIKSASLAADIVANTAKKNKAARQKDDRVIIAADIKVIASLIAAGAKTLHSNDTGFCEIASQFTTAEKLNILPADLLDLVEDRESEDSQSDT